MREITQKEAQEYYRKLYESKSNIESIERSDRKDHHGKYLLVIVDCNFETIDECCVRYTIDEMLEIESLKTPIKGD